MQSQSIFAPPAYNARPIIEAHQAKQKIIIDGRLTEDDWSKCTVVRHFVQSAPVQGNNATYDTEVKILYDDENIYIGAVCSNPGNNIFVQDLRRDFLYGNNELFGVFFDPFQDVQNPVPSFLVTPYGTQRDLLIYDDRIYDLNWDAVWQAESFVADSLWSTEIAIPWSTLRYPADSTTWGINFNRNIRSLNEITGWSPWPYAYTVGRMSYGGLVTNIQPPQTNSNLRIQPYVLQNAAKNSFRSTDFNSEIGGEVKWLLNTNTSLEGTYNTDFAQADADRQVINLKRSSVFFPEKRQFFLENANLFSIGQDDILQPFFSRRIGLDEAGNPLHIDGGLRFIQQSADHALGAVFIQQSNKKVGTSSSFGIIRAQENIGINARVGSMVTFRHDELGNTSNTTVSMDGFWHLSEPLYIRPMISSTFTSGSSTKGLAFFNELSFIKNNVTFTWFETIVSRDYSPKTGFLTRNNFINTRSGLSFTFLTDWFDNETTFFIPSINADIYHTASNKEWQEVNLILIPFQVTTQHGTTLFVSVLPSWQNLHSTYQPVSGIDIPRGIYNYSRVDFNLSTNLSAPYSVLADITTGRFYNGKLNSYTVNARMVPDRHVAFALGLTHNVFFDFPSSSKTIKNDLVVPEVRISFTPKIQLLGFYQYNTDSNTGGLNIRFSWEYNPLSFVYLVFNNVETINKKITTDPLHDQTGIVKISYIRQL